MKRPAPGEIAFIAIGIAGVAVLFMPLAEHEEILPLGFLLGLDPLADVWARLWAAAFLVAIPILASTVRQALFGPLTKWQVRAAYALAFAALSATTFLALSVIVSARGPYIEGAVVFPSTLILAVGSGIVLAATRRSRVPPATHAHVAMLVAWMASVAFILMLLPAEPDGCGPGYYLAIVTFVGYAVEATLRVRRALRSDQAPGAGAPPS
ncbi:MAG: hypothetical protein ACYS9X_12590 [Planctomycetota bacterium]|jgi:hypothetical protein